MEPFNTNRSTSGCWVKAVGHHAKWEGFLRCTPVIPIPGKAKVKSSTEASRRKKTQAAMGDTGEDRGVEWLVMMPCKSTTQEAETGRSLGG